MRDLESTVETVSYILLCQSQLLKTHHMSKLNVWVSLSTSHDVLKLVPQKTVGQDHLDLVRGKEPPRARVPTKAKRQTVLADADKLVQRGAFDGASLLGVLSQAVKAQRVHAVGVGEDFRVRVDGDGGDFDCDSGGDDLAVGEGEGLENLALEGCCITVSMASLLYSQRVLPIVAGCSLSVSFKKLSIFFIDWRALLVKTPSFWAKAVRASSRSSAESSGIVARS